MPCYFFHLEEGDTTLDFPGMELLNLRAAREEAMRSAVEMLLDRAKVLPWSTKPWRLWVTDGSAKTEKALFALQFIATEASKLAEQNQDQQDNDHKPEPSTAVVAGSVEGAAAEAAEAA